MHGGPTGLDARSLALRSRLKRLLGLEAQALEGLNRALALKPLPEAYAWRWEIGCGGRGASLADMDRAIALEPREPCWLVWRGLGRLPGEGSRSQGLSRQALSDFEAALALQRSCVLAQAGAALARSCLRDLRGALACLDKAVGLEGDQAWLFHLRARTRLRLGDREGFVRDAEEAVLLDEGLGYFNDALGEAETVSVRRACRAADRFLAREPRVPWAYVLRGNWRRSPQIKDEAGAIRDFEAALCLRPDCAWAWAHLSRAQLPRSPAKALESISRAVELAPACGWVRTWRGEILRHSGDPAGAIPDFEAGLSLDPDYDLGYAWRGGAKRELGLPGEALEDLNLSLKLNPGYSWAFLQRSLALKELGRAGESLGDCRKAALQAGGVP